MTRATLLAAILGCSIGCNFCYNFFSNSYTYSNSSEYFKVAFAQAPAPDFTPKPESPSDSTSQPETEREEPSKPPPDYTPTPPPDYTPPPDDTKKNHGQGPSTPTTKSGCLIATAAFGSELSPQVQFLRNFRDNEILSTSSGSNFMNVFNAWYYTFSPSVADYERGQPWLQGTIRMAIYPLLGILELSEKSYSILPGEYGSVVAGLTASTLIGLVYFTPIVIGIKRIKTKTKLGFKVYAVITIVATAALLVALVSGNGLALMITTTSFVIALIAVSSLFGAKVALTCIRSLNIRLRTDSTPSGISVK